MIPTSRRDLVAFTPSRFDHAAASAAMAEAEAALSATGDDERPKAERRASSARRRLAQVEANIAACPGGQPPVYWIEPPGVYERTRALGLIAKRGAAHYPGDRDLVTAMRRVVEDAVDPRIDASAVLEFLDRWDGMLAAGEVITGADRHQVDDLMLYFQSHPLVASRLEARAVWVAVVPIVATQMFLVRADNVDFEVRRGPGQVLDERTLGLIPDEDRNEIGWQAWALGTLSEVDRKKSASLSSPPVSLPHSTATTTAAPDGTS